jgi:hypothetical protein
MESKAMPPSLDRALEMLRDCRELSEAEQQSIVDAIASSRIKREADEARRQQDFAK